jgi:hypothetical protein
MSKLKSPSQDIPFSIYFQGKDSSSLLKANDAFTICFKRNYSVTLFKSHACLISPVDASLIRNGETQLNLP